MQDLHKRMKIGHDLCFITANARCCYVLPATLSPRGEVALSEVALALRGENALLQAARQRSPATLVLCYGVAPSMRSEPCLPSTAALPSRASPAQRQPSPAPPGGASVSIDILAACPARSSRIQMCLDPVWLRGYPRLPRAGVDRQRGILWRRST